MKFFVSLLLLCWCGSILALETTDEWQQGAIIRAHVEPGAIVEFLGRDVRVTSDGQFVIGLGRDFGAEAELIVTTATGKRQVYKFPVKQREYNIQKVTGVPQRTVTPDPQQVERSRREAAMATNARKVDLPLTHFADQFNWPLIGRISGVYGSQRFYNGAPNSPHYGVDVAAPTGTQVVAPAAGVVTLAHPDMFFSGGTLIVDHGHGLSSTFIHLSKILVEEGASIEQGQPIALVGATGRATGPHLDWRMNWFDQRVDPTLIVGPMPKAAEQSKN